MFPRFVRSVTVGPPPPIAPDARCSFSAVLTSASPSGTFRPAVGGERVELKSAGRQRHVHRFFTLVVDRDRGGAGRSSTSMRLSRPSIRVSVRRPVMVTLPPTALMRMGRRVAVEIVEGDPRPVRFDLDRSRERLAAEFARLHLHDGLALDVLQDDRAAARVELHAPRRFQW